MAQSRVDRHRQIGKRLRKMRQALQLTDNVSTDLFHFKAKRKSWYHYELTGYIPRDALLYLHDTFGVSPNWVLLGKGPMKID